MLNAQHGKKLTTVKAICGLMLALMLVLTLAAPGCRSTPSTSIQDQPVMTGSIQNFIDIPLCRQATDYTCGAAALQSILYYYGDEWSEGALAEELKSDPDRGTNYRSIMAVAQAEGLQAESRTDMTIDDLQAHVKAHKLVMVALQAWAEDASNYADDWNSGHYAVVVGYDDARIYFMDPLQLGNYTCIPNEDFLSRWHDTDNDNVTRLLRFGIIIWGGTSSYDPAVVLPMG
jgi:predicted double-glycine peptidase